MNSKLWLGVTLALGVVVVTWAADAPKGKPVADPSVQELRAELTALRSEFLVLQERTKRLETTVEELKRAPSPVPLNVPGQKSFLFTPDTGGSQQPAIWGERQVNGWTYYIVPCGQNPAAAEVKLR
jgi:hypothetical protein